MNDTPFPPPTPESEPLPPTGQPSIEHEIPLGSPTTDHVPAAPGPADADEPELELVEVGAGTGADGRSSHGRRTRLAIGAVGLGGLLAVSGWLALAGDGHADDTSVERAGVADVSDTSADEQLDATSQIDVDVDDDASVGADGAPGTGATAMPGDRGGRHGGRPGRGLGQPSQTGEQGMGATAATPGAVPTTGSGGS